jgi:hypothetical protein
MTPQTPPSLSKPQLATLKALAKNDKPPYHGMSLTKIIKALETKGLVKGGKLTKKGQSAIPEEPVEVVPDWVKEGFMEMRNVYGNLAGYTKEFRDPQISYSTCWENWYFDKEGKPHRLGDTTAYKYSRKLIVLAYNKSQKGLT